MIEVFRSIKVVLSAKISNPPRTCLWNNPSSNMLTAEQLHPENLCHIIKYCNERLLSTCIFVPRTLDAIRGHMLEYDLTRREPYSLGDY